VVHVLVVVVHVMLLQESIVLVVLVVLVVVVRVVLRVVVLPPARHFVRMDLVQSLLHNELHGASYRLSRQLGLLTVNCLLLGH